MLALHHGSTRAGWLSVPVFLALLFPGFFFFFLILFFPGSRNRIESGMSAWNRWGTLVSVLRAIKACVTLVLSTFLKRENKSDF